MHHCRWTTTLNSGYLPIMCCSDHFYLYLAITYTLTYLPHLRSEQLPEVDKAETFSQYQFSQPHRGQRFTTIIITNSFPSVSGHYITLTPFIDWWSCKILIAPFSTYESLQTLLMLSFAACAVLLLYISYPDIPTRLLSPLFSSS